MNIYNFQLRYNFFTNSEQNKKDNCAENSDVENDLSDLTNHGTVDELTELLKGGNYTPTEDIIALWNIRINK